MKRVANLDILLLNADSSDMSDGTYKRLFQINPSPGWLYDLGTLKIIEVNDAVVKKYGYTEEELLQMTLMDIMPKANLLKRKDGELMVVEMTTQFIDQSGKPVAFVQINDVKRQHEITKAAITAQERERRYIGGELHDNINQILATVRLYLELAMRSPHEKDELIMKSSRTLNDIIEEIRKISRELISPGLKNNELSDLVDDMVGDIGRATGIHFDVDISMLESKHITLDEKIAIYRIIQEQVNNILKHAKAKRVSIQAFVEKKKATIEITDDGKGFDLSIQKRGVGITNIISRVEVFNGNVEIITSPGEGCIMRITIGISGK